MIRRLSGRPALAACVLLLAGCMGASVDPASTTQDLDPDAALAWIVRALPNADDHDHLDPAHHAGLSTPNFEPPSRASAIVIILQ